MKKKVHLSDYNCGRLNMRSRLGDTLKIFRVLQPAGDRDLHRLHNHKGILTCVWWKQPSEDLIWAIGQAWELGASECRENVEHLTIPNYLLGLSLRGSDDGKIPPSRVI